MLSSSAEYVAKEVYVSKATELNLLLKEVRGLDAKLKKLSDEEDVLNTERRAKHKRAQELIQSGVTTGNLIRDYVMARYGGIIDPARERAYRTVNKHLAGKTGELVAIITYEDERTYGPHDRTVTVKRMYLGVLRDDKLRFALGKQPSCSLPIDSYAKVDDTIGKKNFGIVKEPFKEHYTGTFETLKDHGTNDERPSDKYHMAVVAGTKKVRDLAKYQLFSILAEDQKVLRNTERELGFLELGE